MTDLPPRADYGARRPSFRNLSEEELLPALDEAVVVLVDILRNADEPVTAKKAAVDVCSYLGRSEESSYLIIAHAHRQGIIDHAYSDVITLL